MNIYIDESGVFTCTDALDSWSVVAGVTSTESARRLIQASLATLRRRVGALPHEEVKLDSVSEAQYLELLNSLNHPSVLLFAVATDTGTQTVDQIQSHKQFHIEDLRRNIPRMKHEGGKAGLTLLAEQIERLSPQLYVQLFCQVSLLFEIISLGSAYFALRHPTTLSSFRWRIDPKDKTRTNYESAFLKLAPALIQARSIREPFTTYRQLDYSRMKNFEFTEDTYPEHLHTDHGLPRMEGFDLQKILGQYVRFPDSKSSDGIQVADLLVRGLRRVLRKSWDDPDAVATAIGRLTGRQGTGGPSIKLINFSRNQMVLPATGLLLSAMGESSRPLPRPSAERAA